MHECFLVRKTIFFWGCEDRRKCIGTHKNNTNAIPVVILTNFVADDYWIVVRELLRVSPKTNDDEARKWIRCGREKQRIIFKRILRASHSVKSISWARETSNPAVDDRSLIDSGFRNTATRDRRLVVYSSRARTRHNCNFFGTCNDIYVRMKE